MKNLLLIPIIFLSACSSTHQRPLALRATPVGRSVNSSGLRTEDQLKGPDSVATLTHVIRL